MFNSTRTLEHMGCEVLTCFKKMHKLVPFMVPENVILITGQHGVRLILPLLVIPGVT